MAHLSIRLLGGFHVSLDDILIHFPTQKARALLAYLAVEDELAHSRTHLAGMLWPTQPESRARAYLRQALADLRKSVHDGEGKKPFLRITNQTIQLDPISNQWVDVTALGKALNDAGTETPLSSDMAASLAAATDSYRGRFLKGFFLKECRAFEEWQLLTAEMLQRQAVDALSLLVTHYEQIDDIAAAQRYAWRRAELEPLSDDANYSLIRLLAAGCDPAAARTRYDAFVELLSQELKTTPAPETRRLVEQISTGPPVNVDARSAHTAIPPLPPFLPEYTKALPRPPFVARKQELDRLHQQLDIAINGSGSILFVAGDAGQGKTALLQAFVREAAAQHADLIAVGGRCSNFQGMGDPYLPFREVLAQLSGDFMDQWEAGELDREQTLMLWQYAPRFIDLLLDQGPDLIGTLISENGLAAQISALGKDRGRGQRLDDLVQRRPAVPVSAAHQHALCDQCTRVLRAMARDGPLLVTLDDLQWIDLSSLALLFHWGQRLSACRILIVGAYRPEEVALGLHGASHPLTALIAEFQQRYGPIEIDLDEASGRDFIDDYLDIQPNRFDDEFHRTFYEKSGGHPLYSIELLHELQVNGVLRQDDAGFWFQATDLDWHVLSPRIEAVIGRRIRRLPSEFRVLLEAAAVQGNEFSAGIIASVVGDAITDVRRALQELERRHRMIVQRGPRHGGIHQIADYRFEHILFRQYIYDCLDGASRVTLHEAVATVMEAFYAGALGEQTWVAGRLAWHFQKAGRPEKAVPYAAVAGEAAQKIHAYNDALAHYGDGLTLIDSLPEGQARDALELKLLIGVGTIRLLTESGAASGLGQIWHRAHSLCDNVGEWHQRFQILWCEWNMHFLRGEMRPAQESAERCLCTALAADAFVLESYSMLVPTLYRLGKMQHAHDQYEQARMLLTDIPVTYTSPLASANPVVDVRANGSLALWYLGYPDQARKENASGIRAAESLNHPFSLAFALIFAAGLHQRAMMLQETAGYAHRVMETSNEHGFTLWYAVGQLYHGWALVAQGNKASGLHEAKAGLAAIRATGMEHIRYAAVLADVYHQCGEIDAGLAEVDAMLATIARTDEREWEAELHRLRGELLGAQGADLAMVEACFETAVEIAAEQEAKSLELRATLSLAQLLDAQGRVDEAEARLDAIYRWFNEGLDTPDMQTAAALLTMWQERDA